MSSSVGVVDMSWLPVESLQYRDLSDCAEPESDRAANGDSRGGQAHSAPEQQKLSAAEIEALVTQAKAAAAAEIEERLRAEYEQKLQTARAPIAKMIEAFEAQKVEYFARAEAEIIQLSLAIARKILHREAQVDPMLVATLIRISLEKMQEGSNVTIRLAPGQAGKWRTHLASVPSLAEVDVVEDVHLSNVDCVVDTELGSANFGLDAQMKEVEQGFFDLLALRPASQ